MLWLEHQRSVNWWSENRRSAMFYATGICNNIRFWWIPALECTWQADSSIWLHHMIWRTFALMATISVDAQVGAASISWGAFINILTWLGVKPENRGHTFWFNLRVNLCQKNSDILEVEKKLLHSKDFNNKKYFLY